MRHKCSIIFIFSIICSFCNALFEGDACVLKNNGEISAGKCLKIDKCDYAKKLLKSGKSIPQSCGFNRFMPLVCCPKSLAFQSESTRSEDKCSEYHNKRSIRKEVAHGQEAEAREFPHMAALGYGQHKSSLSWLCGGSLISDRFILTAAHCTTSSFGDPTWVRLGELNLNSTADDAEPIDIQVEKIFVHPNYRSPSHYNDIALIKLNRSINFSFYINPACIHVSKKLPNKQMQAIGWGVTDFLGDPSNHLMKVFLNIVEHKKCANLYRNVSARKLQKGIDDETQICTGGPLGEDTCPGDSGGPLHFKKETENQVLEHFVIVGITSFGKGCGFENSAGVYTRVSYYRPWIENIVWPL